MKNNETLIYAFYLSKLFPSAFSSDCSTNPIGVSNPHVIPDSHMTASSAAASSESRFQPAFGRLGGNRGDGWCSGTSASNSDWLQIYFGDMFTVCRVDTQGDIDGNKSVKAFKLSFSSDGNSWTTHKFDNGTDVVRHYCVRNLPTITRFMKKTDLNHQYMRMKFHPFFEVYV